MDALHNFDAVVLLNVAFNLLIAFLLGGCIGIERQIRQRTAGLRTNTLVSVGAAAFIVLANRLEGHEGMVHVAAYVVSGIGFLGAGAIMKEGANITGLNTAATLWGSAAVGTLAGASLAGEAIVVALFVLASNTLLRPVVNRINRSPINESSSEATYHFYVICRGAVQVEMRERLSDALEAIKYPARDMVQHRFGTSDLEIQATLYATAVDGDELDRLALTIEAWDGVLQAFWTTGAED